MKQSKGITSHMLYESIMINIFVLGVFMRLSNSKQKKKAQQHNIHENFYFLQPEKYNFMKCGQNSWP